MVKSLLLKGLGTLFKGKGKDVAKTTLPDTTDNIQNVFFKNITDEFGSDEVKEALRILKTGADDPQLQKLFNRPNESNLDELVNLLEGRYMSSERLHASPISFRRRGPGAAERYLKINDSGSRLTDLPGGPGDKVLYGKNYGEMSMTKNSYTGERVYKNEKPTIFDEGTQVTDKGKTIEGVAEEIPTGIPAATKVDDMVTKMQAMEKEAESMLAFAKRDQQQISDAIDTFNRMMDDGEDPAEAIRMLKEIMKKGRSKNAKGGRIKMFKGGLARLLKMINPELERRMVKTGPFETGHRADAVVDMEQIKNIARNEATNLEDIYKIEDMIQNSPRYNDKMKNAFMNLIDYEKFRANALYDNPKLQKHMKNDPEGTEEFLRMVYKEQGSDSGFNMGGRVGMLAGGSLIGKGIMEAAKLAQRGMKPFGAKQTYKQNVTQKGVSNEQFDEIFKKQLNRVPDEVVDEPTGRGLNSSLLEAEAILTGQKFGLLTQAQRTKIAQAMRDKVAKQIYDDPNPRLSNDYFEYMDNAVDRMDDLLEIEKLGGDLTPKPIFDGTEIIGAQVDFRQLDKLGNKAKDNIIPFKPKTKKSKGGTVPPLKGPMSDGMGSLFRSK